MSMSMSKRLVCHTQAAKRGMHLLHMHPLTTIMTVAVLAITLTLPTLFWVFTEDASKITNNLTSNNAIFVYLEPSLSDVDTAALMARIKKITDIKKISLTSAAEGIASLQQQDGMHDIMQALANNNPLPAVINVTPSTNTPEIMTKLAQTIKTYPHVAEVRYDKQWVTALHSAIQIAATAANGLLILLGAAVIFIIGNSMRLAMHAGREEVQVLQLIGATDAFIIRPFLYAGIGYGIAGSLLALIIVYILLLGLDAAVQSMTAALNYSLPGLTIAEAGAVLLVAIVLGWAGAWIAIKNQLRVCCI